MVFKFLRKYVKVFLWVMAVLIIPSFILWGVGSSIRSYQKSHEAGRIFRHRVTWEEYETSLRTIEMLLSLSNLQTYVQFLNPIDLAWDRLILLHEAKRRKIEVSNEKVIAYVQKIPAFQGEGSFDVKRYEEMLARAFRTTPRIFEEEVRKTLILSKLREQIVAEVSLDEETLKEEYQHATTQRKVSYVEFATETFVKEVSLLGEETASYYETHKRDFERPEEIRVAFVTTDFDEKKSKQEVREAMDKLSDDLLHQTEKRKDPGSVFQETGFFALEDPLPHPDLSYELSLRAFQMEIGKISDPIETASGITILKVLEKRPPRILSLEEAKPKVEETLRREKAETLCRKNAEERLHAIQKKMNEEKTSWEDTVKSAALSLKETEFFTQRGYIEKIGMAPELTRAAFALSLKEVGGVVKIPNGFVILRPEEETPFNEEAFLKEKESFLQKLLARKQMEYYNRWFETLRSQAHLISHVESPEPKSSESPVPLEMEMN
ncbi:MAG: peptidyl-prolyl cis-trans isomerase [Candidatus Omnitrophica bacterium]|nr:peptidyl-prolyl cis-trans isomerase [Candidatus Omnitrophota bacterium]